MADAFFTSAAANAVGTMMTDYFVKPIERRIRYFFRFQMIVKKLDQQKKKLITEQTRVKNEVEEAKLQIQTQVIEDYVSEWLTNAENALEDAQSLETRIELNKRCFRWCPNLSWRYQLSMEMEEKILDMADLVENSKFERYGHREKLPGLEFFPSKDFVPSESSTAAFDKMMEALKDEKVNMIGVWGMGGVGKTTLVNEVGRKVKDSQLFHKVIQVVVSQTPIIENIQEKIKDFLDLNFSKTTKEGRAEELWLRLKNEEKVLIILDDMWNELDLKEIGLPLVENGKGCKIILTTRRKPVCESMECQVNVPIDVLDDDEAWALFKMKANLDEKVSGDIVKEAQKVAKECKGLPVAIIAVARALKATRNRKGWEVARKKLESNRFMEIGNIAEDEKNAYKCIEMSYEYLKKETNRRCLLLCALHPEDYSVGVEDVVRYAWGLELYKADSIEEARTEVIDAIDHLKDSCLLLEDSERHVKLHDVVRDVVLWIASKEKSDFVIKSRLELLDESSQSCNAISLLNINEENKFPERLVYPKLEILLLKNCDVQGTCFQRMNELKVLSLSVEYDSPRIISLYALRFLRKLRALHLENLRDLSFLGNLTTLEILSLRGRELQGLDDELGKLENLKMLDLTDSNFSSTFPSNVIGRLSKLEELYLGWAQIGDDIIGEIKVLTRLTALSLSRRYFNFLEELDFSKLERYDISLDYKLHRYESPVKIHLTERCWKIEAQSRSDEYVECFTDKTQQLIELMIRECCNVKVIFQKEKVREMDTPMLSNLRKLYLDRLRRLSCIWDSPTRHVSLGSLVELRILKCPSLKILFPLFVAQSLVVLEILEISECHGLEQIFTDLEGDEEEEEEEISSTSACHNSLCFPRLREVSITKCEGLEYVFPTLMAPQGLQGLSLVLRKCPELKQVIRVVKNDSNVHQQQLQFLRLLSRFEVCGCPQLGICSVLRKDENQNLAPEVSEDGQNGSNTSLHISDCDDFESLVDTRKNLQQNLRQLDVRNCTSFRVVFQMDDDDEVLDENQDEKPLSNLQSLELHFLNGLKCLFKGSPHSFSLQSLKIVIITFCRKVEYLFPPSVIPSLVLLEDLKIERCDELIALFGPELENDDGEIENPPLCLPKLKILTITHCDKLEYALPITLAQGLPALEMVEVQFCQGLKQFFFGMPKEEDIVLLLHSLNYMNLSYLQNLASFVPKNYIVKAPALKKLIAFDSRRTWNYFPLQLANEQLELDDVPLISVYAESLRSTRDLTLRGVNDDDCKTLVPDLVNLEDMEELTSLYIVSFLNLQSLVDTCGRSCKAEAFLPNLKKLKIYSVDKLEQVFRIDELRYDKEENQAVPLLPLNLEHLDLGYLKSLRWIINAPSTLYVCLQTLKVLNILVCNNMDHFFPVSVVQTLSSLEELTISGCDKLKSVFIDRIDQSNSATLCLPKLKSVEIGYCPSLEYVFPLALAPSFPRLQKLKLAYLRELRHFVVGYDFVEAPALEFLHVTSCPRMYFTIQKQVNNHVPLKELYFTMGGEDSGSCEDSESCNMVSTHSRQTLPDFEYITAGNFEQMLQLQGGYFISSLEKMTLHHMIWLQHIWKGHIHVATNLRELEVQDCNRLTYIFPATLVRHYLPQLCILKIKSCENLKQIIANDDTLASSSRDPCQLEMKMVFPRLKRIEFENLSRLESFSPVGYDIVFPCLEKLDIKKCFKMITTFTVEYLTLIVHAKTDQASQADDTSPSQEVIYWDGRRPSLLPLYVEEAQEISPF